MKKFLLVLGLIALVAPCVVGAFAADWFVNTQTQSCSVVGAVVGQVGTNQPQPGAPRTVDECVKLVQTSKPFTYGVVWFITYVGAGVLAGFGVMASMLFGFFSSRT